MSKITVHENEGLHFIQKVVKSSGHIFTPIPSKGDNTIDGLIEFVTDNQATGLLVAVKVLFEKLPKSITG